ncbi:MAG: signal peptidase I [Bacilli bacterium]|nr:signal peptidase I [Bacilli bacterium]
MKIVKKIINVLTTIIICVGGLFLILYILGIVPYVVLSGSMEPSIETGSVCFINKHAKFEDIKEKDVIAFKMKDGTLVTHRAIEINDSGIVTKGDNNKDADNNIVTKGNFVGKNLFWIPKVGYVIKAFQTTTGRIIAAALILLLLVSGFLFGDDNKKVKN